MRRDMEPADVTVEIPGFDSQVVSPDLVPPVGASFTVHKHLTDGGTTLHLEVTAHEWRLEEPQEIDGGSPYFSLQIKTKLISKW